MLVKSSGEGGLRAHGVLKRCAASRGNPRPRFEWCCGKNQYLRSGARSDWALAHPKLVELGPGYGLSNLSPLPRFWRILRSSLEVSPADNKQSGRS